MPTRKAPRKAYNRTKTDNQPSATIAQGKSGGEANALTYARYFSSLADKYGDMSIQSVSQAAKRAAELSGAFTMDPYVQNRRVKQVSSLPVDRTKDDIARMLQAPDGNEQHLRETGNILEYTSYTMAKIRATYQDLLTYHHYVYPAYVEDKEAQGEAFLREWRLAEKVSEEIQPGRAMRQIVGQCIRDGKVFYVPRVEVDKSHNQVKYAFLQQLPQDWVKIVGFNNISKYTVAMNLFYFMQPGTDWRQFGDLFLPYVQDFYGLMGDVQPAPKGTVYASLDSARMGRIQEALSGRTMAGNPEISYSQNGEWMYWVTLPPEKVFTFEADDVKANVVSPLTGLYLSAAQQAQMEQVQLEITTNPLVAMVLGTMETYDTKDQMQSDAYKVSIAGRELFNTYFDMMLKASNTGGIGRFFAPFRDMRLVQLSESPNANKISSEWNSYLVGKSGLSGIMPTSDEARAGIAQISLKIESQFARHMYGQFERMMNVVYRLIGGRWEWRMRMFGSLAEDDNLLKASKEGMTLGILSDTLTYNALMGRSILTDLSVSRAVKGTGILDMRLPLVSTYSAKAPDAGFPPAGGTANKGGRPSNAETGKGIATEGAENDADEGATAT